MAAESAGDRLRRSCDRMFYSPARGTDDITDGAIAFLNITASFRQCPPNTDLMEFEIHSDEFELIAFIGRNEAWPQNVQFEKRPFSAVAKLLDFPEEPKTAEGYAEQEQVFVETYQLMFQAMVGAWARLMPKPRVEAYVRETDGLQAIELSTGKTVDVTVFESRLYYIRPEPVRIEYRPLSVSEKARLPQLFTRPPAQMSDEEIGKDLDRYFEFTFFTGRSAVRCPLIDSTVRSSGQLGWRV